MTTKIFFNYYLTNGTVSFEYNNEGLSLPADCFVTDFSFISDDQYVDAEFAEGFEMEILDRMVEEKFYKYSKGQLASKGTWKDIKAAWLIEKNDK